ncbi:type II toxin-antitoxin system Phd/YefM family antitoxin [Flagellimonas flava]|uniref:type II toxin-antitoxin system Phd/YefM family antitoxin n=1 Tax=Flagellimonas flava TaxID=570519 RepID=UPI001FE77583|nr:type II toxin-antitoxin system prevent-host-death family antitoxin [Allomuricauda flava]
MRREDFGQRNQGCVGMENKTFRKVEGSSTLKISTYMRTFYYLYGMETVNYTDFRANLKYWLDKVVNDVSDIVIKRKNGKDLVLISLDEYNSLKETAYLLSGKNRDVLLESIKELESGKGVQKDLIE